MGDPGGQPSSNPSQQTHIEDSRLWQHKLHEDNMLFQRGNLFLLAQSLLVVAYTTILSAVHDNGQSVSPSRMLLAGRVIAAFGFLLTLTWLYVGHRHLKYCQLIQARTMDRMPEYAETRALVHHRRGIRSLPLVTYLLPLLAGAMWLFLLLIS
jgi:hypothetical protein